MSMENNAPIPQLEDFAQFGELVGLTPEQIAQGEAMEEDISVVAEIAENPDVSPGVRKSAIHATLGTALFQVGE
jgi:hypothetical protein